jgi:hypothetical protein
MRLALVAVGCCVGQGAGFAHAMNIGRPGWALEFVVLFAVTGAALTLIPQPDPDMLELMTAPGVPEWVR